LKIPAVIDYVATDHAIDDGFTTFLDSEVASAHAVEMQFAAGSDNNVSRSLPVESEAICESQITFDLFFLGTHEFSLST
jgi:hypothetical protein